VSTPSGKAVPQKKSSSVATTVKPFRRHRLRQRARPDRRIPDIGDAQSTVQADVCLESKEVGGRLAPQAESGEPQDSIQVSEERLGPLSFTA
jgi:hypothetical protein